VLNFLATSAVFAFLVQTAAGLDLFKLRLWQSVLYSGLATVVFWLVWLARARLYESGRRGRLR
ncbi:MAG: hypothetical protein ABSG53_26370, partial [Thermoguttaceae bacterium]